MIDRRSAPRQETYRAARIAFGGNRPVTSCIVRNVSEGGACLTVESAIDVPDAFNLVFTGGEPSRVCYVMWRQEKRIGVAFAEENRFQYRISS